MGSSVCRRNDYICYCGCSYQKNKDDLSIDYLASFCFLIRKNNLFKLFYFALRGGSNWLKGFKLHFKNGSLFQSIKRKGSRQVIESAESLYFKRFSHICLERIVSKCGFTFPQIPTAVQRDKAVCHGHTVRSILFDG